MKFKRADLIIRVEAAIAAKGKAAADRNATAAKNYAKSVQEHVAKTRDGWKQLADVIRVRLRQGVPITGEDIPMPLRDGYASSGRIATWTAREPDQHVADTTDLENLLTLLRAATDVEITTTVLERMGFRVARLLATR